MGNADVAIWRRGGFVWGMCALLAGLADWMFYGRPWGVNVAVFVGVLYAVMVVRLPGLWRSWLGRVWVVMTVGMIGGLVEEPSLLAMVMVVIGVGTTALLAERALGETVGAWVSQWMHLVGTMWVRWVMDQGIVVKWLQRHPRARGVVGKVVKGIMWWVVPVMLGSVFVGLFAVANPVIEKWVGDFFEWVGRVFRWLPELLAADRMLLWGVVGLGAYGLLRYRRMRVVRRGEAVSVPPVVETESWWNGAGLVVRCLVVFNVVFGVQSVLDVTYLFGGAALPVGMTWKEYAHRGAYPLVATALLTGLFVLVTFRRGGPAVRSAWARRLVYAWIVQNILLLGSTVWRLYLYVDVGGLTRLRVSTMIWLGLVAMGFGWVILKIVRGYSGGWLVKVNVVTTLVVLYGCAFVNFDGLIADYNVRHCCELNGRDRGLDWAYLEHLGPESLPALAWLGEHAPGSAGKVEEVAGRLREELRGEMGEWRGWTWRRARIAGEDGMEKVGGPEVARK